jgi:single-strand DNA-binding protein
MNKVILMGRLTRDPEVLYSQAKEPKAIAKFSLAVNRRFKKDGEPDADFINCVAFGKNGEFTEKYFHKGQQVSIVGHLQTGSYEKDGIRRYTTTVIVEEQHFAGPNVTKKGTDDHAATPVNSVDGFVSVDNDDMPF